MATYQRIPFKQEGVEFVTKRAAFSTKDFDIPIMDYPITPVENFKLSWKNKTPAWAPVNMMDYDSVRVTYAGATGSPMMGGDERVEYTDDWGCEWVYVPVAGGSMLKPGTQFLEDITQWREKVKFPDWKSRDYETPAEEFHANRRNKDTVLAINLGQGCTERLVALLGGYTEAMIAMAEEPEAVLDFLHAFADNLLERYDIIKALYPTVNLITYHDDWGTERDTFFSESFFESMVWAPTKKIIDHIKASGDICFELHSCGKIERFMPYILDLGVNLLQIQRRANDMPMLKEKYGDRIGFCCMLEGVSADVPITKEERMAKIRQTIDLYGKSGGIYLTLGAPPDPETMWDSCYEAYCYSREYYDKERGAELA
ncbi:MAG: hypothetical protein FWF83_04245 [Clostridiales bacterium]|nr:hypothetical protein [Clostridiales bacterium]